MNIITKKLMGGGNTLNYLLGAIVVFCSAQMVQAADRYWKTDKIGGSEDNPFLLKDSSNWKDGASAGNGHNIHFNIDGARTYISSTGLESRTCNDFTPEAGDFVFIGDMNFYCLKGGAQDKKVSILKKGYWNLSSKYDMKLANSAGSSFFLTNETGNVTIGKSSDESSVRVANEDNTTAEVVNIAGDWNVTKTLYLAYGKNSHARWIHRGGTLSAAEYGLVIGKNIESDSCSAYLEVSGGLVKNTAGHVLINEFAKGGSVEVLVTGGELRAEKGDLRVGVNAGATLTISDNGLVSAPVNGVVFCNDAKCVAGRDSFLNLNGGTLQTKKVRYGNGAAAATFNFNGGTLKALDAGELISQHENLTVNVDAGGAIIDTNSKDVSIVPPLKAVSPTGGLTVTGGGSLIVSGDLTGAITVGENTTLHYFDQDGAANTYELSSLTLGAGSTLTIDGGDSFGNTLTTINATSESKTTIVVSFASAPAANSSIPLFPATEADLKKVSVIPMLGALELPKKVSIIDGKLTLTITAEDYIWNGSQKNWGDQNAWTKGGVDFVWSDGNNAIFSTANAKAVLSASVSASEVRFTADATVSGTSALSASKIDVSKGVAATISAPFGSPIIKSGLGTLTLADSAANTCDITLAEGTLNVGANSSLDWKKFIFGVDSSKPVTLRVGADATIVNNSNMNYGVVPGVTSTLIKDGGDWDVAGNFLLCRDVENTTANLIHNGGTLTVRDYFSVGDCADATFSSLEINGGTVNSMHSGNRATIGASCDATGIVRNGGKFNVSANLLLGNHAAGTLTIDDGGIVDASDIVFHFSDDGGASLLNLKTGGELLINRIYYRTNGNNEDCTFRFDGGIIKCKYQELITAHDHLFIKVASNGGIIDLQGKTVAINEPLLEDVESTGGGMTFKGGGVVTLAEGNTYTGKTTVEVGTTVYVTAPSDIGGGLVVTLPETTLADDVYSLVAIEGEGVFDADLLSNVVAPENTTLRLSSDKKSVLCIYGNPMNTWIGGASGSLNDNTKWSLGIVPAPGEYCVIGNAIAANLTNPSDSAFAPASITFPADSAAVTISGEGVISGVEAIINNASVHHVFNCPVVCKDGITPDITRGAENYMTFAGGITMYDAPKTGGTTTDYWSGNITVTTKTPQEFKSSGLMNYAELIQGTTFTFDNGIIDRLRICSGSTAVANRLVYEGCARSSKSGNKTAWYSYVFDNGNGVLRVKEIEAKGDVVLFHSYADSDQQGGTIIAEKLISATTKNTGGGGWDYPLFFLNCGNTTGNTFASNASPGEGVWVIGRGGLSFGSDAYERSFYGVHLGKILDNGRPAATLHSYEDWALAEHPLGASQTVLEISSGHEELLVIDTSHYMVGDPALDVATSHTVTLNGKVKGEGNLRIEGSGKVIFANKHNTFSGGLTVSDTATVAIKAGASLPANNTTVKSGAALEVFESGTVTLGGNITLEDGAVLGFNFSDRKIVPVLEIADGKTVTFGENKAIKVFASGIKRPVAGKHILTSGGDFSGASVTLAEGSPNWVKGVSVEDGAIVLDVKSIGTVLTVR